MTFQVALVGTDGVLLATDRKIADYSGYRTGENTPKIRYSLKREKPVMYCWSGSEHPGLVAEKVTETLAANPNLLGNSEDSIGDVLVEAAGSVYMSKYGCKGSIAMQNLGASDGGTLLLAHRTSDARLELWAQDYRNYRNSCRPIENKSSVSGAGDDRNAAIFFVERYYEPSMCINDLILLAGHTVLMSSRLNPTGIDGLDIGIWRISEDRPRQLNPSEIEGVKSRSTDLDSFISHRLRSSDRALTV